MKEIIASILFLFCSCLYGQNQLPSFISENLDNYIGKGLQEWKIPGIALVIIKDGKVIVKKGYGIKTLGKSEPVDENTLFYIGSNTKAFTALTLAILQDEKKVNLQDPVKKWIPDFRLRDSLASSESTIIDILSHRIGFETFQGDFTYWGSNLSRTDVIHKMAFIQAPYGFRTKYGYCNAGYTVGGQIIEKVCQKSWEDAVSEKILQPLNMTHTKMIVKEKNDSLNMASGYGLFHGKLQEYPLLQIDALAPAASMCSNANDIAKWLQAQLKDGLIEGKQVISKEALKTLHQPNTIIQFNPEGTAPTHFKLYGLGLQISDYEGKTVYSHSGAVDGFLSYFMIIPEEKLGIAVLTNTDGNFFYSSLANEIRDAFMGLPFRNYSELSWKKFYTNYFEKEAKFRKDTAEIAKRNLLSIPLDSLAGTYENEVYGQVQLTRDQNYLTAHFSNHPSLTAKMEYIKNDTFLCTYSNPVYGIEEIPFHIKPNQEFGFTLRVDEFLEFTTYDFHKIH